MNRSGILIGSSPMGALFGMARAINRLFVCQAIQTGRSITDNNDDALPAPTGPQTTSVIIQLIPKNVIHRKPARKLHNET